MNIQPKNIRKLTAFEREADLIEGLQTGHRIAFDEAYRKYHPVMLRVAAKYASTAVAEDIARSEYDGSAIA